MFIIAARAVSSGTPEVNNYPFTTRGVSIGHLADPDSDEKLQVHIDIYIAISILPWYIIYMCICVYVCV
jgi:hypothetical protein